MVKARPPARGFAYWRGYVAGTLAQIRPRLKLQYLAGYVAGLIARFRP